MSQMLNKSKESREKQFFPSKNYEEKDDVSRHYTPEGCFKKEDKLKGGSGL